MADLSNEFKKLHRGEKPESSVFVPLLMWCSAKRSNIEAMQRINRRFFKVDQKILIRELTLTNTVDHFLSFPKESDSYEYDDWFYRDLASYLGWTLREVKNNLDVIDVESLKETIALEYGYEDSQRQDIGLEKRGYR